MFRLPAFLRPSRLRRQRRARSNVLTGSEMMEARLVLSADTLPVLMVIADQQDFYYQEYNDTRNSIEAAGLSVEVAATTTAVSVPHQNSGQVPGESGAVTPDLALADADAGDYSAIVFVGGWGSSMYQYDFPGDYGNNRYDGELTAKRTVNDLIGDFATEEKHVAAICHGVTVLAWARVDGVSPISGRQVSVPNIGSPAVLYNETWYNDFEPGQYEQAVANGAIPNVRSGQYGDPNTAADDVVVDGRIITAENYDSAALFGTVIAEQILASPPPVPDAPSASVRMEGDDLIVQGSGGDDTIYVWSGASRLQVGVWMNDVNYGMFTVASHGQVVVHAGDGNDRVFATDTSRPVMLAGEAGHDLLTGGSADDLLDGGPGVDRIYGGAGNDVILGGDQDDVLLGETGADIVVGGSGADTVVGGFGNDLLIGGAGTDYLSGGSDQDILIGGTTTFDDDVTVLQEIQSLWNSADSTASRAAQLQTGTRSGLRLRSGAEVSDDKAADTMCGGDDFDLFFPGVADNVWSDDLDLFAIV